MALAWPGRWVVLPTSENGEVWLPQEKCEKDLEMGRQNQQIFTTGSPRSLEDLRVWFCM